MPQARHIPDPPPEWKQKQPKPDLGRSYAIELITPLFGGGVETRVNDPSFPIRATSIRGQLQFWWRATVGAQYASRQELRAAQSAIWGNTEQASRVIVRAEVLDKPSEPKVCAVIKPNHKGKDQVFWEPPFHNTAIPYTLFPFQGKPANREGPKVDPASYIQNAKFRLTLICPDHLWPDVEPALWAWVNFGGLGSRTRRGCGAIFCKALAPKDRNELLARLKTFLQAPNAQSREWPTLAAAFLVGSEESQALSAWNTVIGKFQHFRQGVGLGRNPNQQQPNRPGRSRWSEPETIRRVTGQRNGRHGRFAHIPDDAFPRAELGLPIVFHFQNERNDRPKDPEENVVLYPENNANERRERMASPLILKPLALANGKFVPLIVRLKTPALTGVDLRQGERSLPLPQPTFIRDPRLATYRDSPMQNRSPNGSALEAFLAYAKSQGFTEVSR